MGIQPEEERDKEVMRIPERLERLLADLMVSSGIHQKHTQKHDVPSDTTGFSVVDLDGGNGTDLVPLNVEETALVSMLQHRTTTVLT